MVDCESAAGECHEFIAGADIIPRIAGHYVKPGAVFEVELFCRILQAVVETCATSPGLELIFICRQELVGVSLESGCREK